MIGLSRIGLHSKQLENQIREGEAGAWEEKIAEIEAAADPSMAELRAWVKRWAFQPTIRETAEEP